MGTFTTRALAREAAAVCDVCPLATDCLLEALRLDADRKNGRDLWGITGCCGGVWFSPEEMPTRVVPLRRPRRPRRAPQGPSAASPRELQAPAPPA